MVTIDPAAAQRYQAELKEPREAFYRMPRQERAAAYSRDQGLATEHGFARPYASPDTFGICPGWPGSERGHGLSASTVHSHGCCQKWALVRELTPTKYETDKEPGE